MQLYHSKHNGLDFSKDIEENKLNFVDDQSPKHLPKVSETFKLSNSAINYYSASPRKEAVVLNEEALKQVFENVLQDEIANSLRPNSFTPENDIMQMRQFYLERVAEIIRDQAIEERDLHIQQLVIQLQEPKGQDVEIQIMNEQLRVENDALSERVRGLTKQREDFEVECKQELKLMNIRNDDLLEKLKRQSSSEGADFQAYDERVKRLISELDQEITHRQNLQKEVFNTNLDLKKVTSEKESLSEDLHKMQQNKQQDLKKYEQYGETLKSLYEQ